MRASAILAFLANPFVLVLRYLPLQCPMPRRTDDVSRLVLGSMGCAIGIALLNALFGVDWASPLRVRSKNGWAAVP